MSDLTCRCGCERRAVLLGTGVDYDGSKFVDEPMCQSAADYCYEAASEDGLPFSVRPADEDEAA